MVLLIIRFKLVLNFNSIKVRLKPAHQDAPTDILSDFNSIKVRLKLAVSPLVLDTHHRHFNSIKVRLKPPLKC